MDVLKEFHAAIDIETARNLQDFTEHKRLPLDERVAKGVTMTNLRAEMKFYDNLPNPYCSRLSGTKGYILSVKISCDNNISKFKEGSSVVLSNGSHSYEMDIEEDSWKIRTN